MADTLENKEKQFETEHWYAIFSGFLIIPAIVALLTLLGATIMVIFVDPSELSGFDLVFYWVDAVYIPLLLFIFYTWFTRKRYFLVLMIVFFSIRVLLNLTYFISGYGIDPVNLVVSIIWIIYFIRSERVKQTFVK